MWGATAKQECLLTARNGKHEQQAYIHFPEQSAIVGLSIEVQGGWLSLHSNTAYLSYKLVSETALKTLSDQLIFTILRPAFVKFGICGASNSEALMLHASPRSSSTPW